MNKDILEGKWTELKGKVKSQFNKLTDDDLDKIEGDRMQLEGMIQQRYGYTKEQVKEELSKFYNS